MTISNEMPCRGCQAPIRFIKMRTGGKMPVESAAFKMVVLASAFVTHGGASAEVGSLVDCYEPHWGNCKRAKEFKRKGKP